MYKPKMSNEERDALVDEIGRKGIISVVAPHTVQKTKEEAEGIVSTIIQDNPMIQPIEKFLTEHSKEFLSLIYNFKQNFENSPQYSRGGERFLISCLEETQKSLREIQESPQKQILLDEYRKCQNFYHDYISYEMRKNLITGKVLPLSSLTKKKY